MKELINYPILVYVGAGIACLGIMIIIDYLLGTEAEHLNAWVIVNRLFGRDTGIGNSLAIHHLGLAGATFLMLFVNMIFGGILIQLLRLFIGLIHS